ncbi:hypothetical protein ITP53_10755 [Nonomuraea sp. K274]|uniref:Uncharacterized protein n=1 Tax=Nonomuraea cypriaca TaxID=1187855 RepID=A0A931EY83_9ACTN|nr:hypothetical protein [Nonomuraea cypriaca]
MPYQTSALPEVVRSAYNSWAGWVLRRRSHPAGSFSRSRLRTSAYQV